MLRQPATITGPAHEPVRAIGVGGMRRRRGAPVVPRAPALCAVAVAVALLAGCGVKGPLVPARKAAVPAAPAAPAAPALPPPATTAPAIPEATAPARPNPAP
jgi:hypothetical protein